MIAALQPDFVGGGGLGDPRHAGHVGPAGRPRPGDGAARRLDRPVQRGARDLRGDPAGADARAAGGRGAVGVPRIATAVGAVNGLLVAYTQVPSFALTLGTLGILQAASLVISGATTVYVTANSDLLAPLFGSAHRCPADGVLARGDRSRRCSGCCCAAPPSDRRMTAVGLNESGRDLRRDPHALDQGAGLRPLRAARRRRGHHDHRSGRRGVVVRPRAATSCCPASRRRSSAGRRSPVARRTR